MKIRTKTGLRVFAYADIERWGPCYKPSRYIAESWRGTAVDILDLKEVSHSDRLWVCLRTDLCSEKLMRLFAVWCARQVQHLMKDARSIAALDVAERFANGQATKEELAAARAAARDAAWAAARDAAWDAAWDAARDAAWAAAGAAARAAARDAQIEKLKEMFRVEGLERLALRRSKRGNAPMGGAGVRAARVL